MVQNENFNMQRGYEENFCFDEFFDCVVKFWNLPYGPKTQWSNSQKAKLIGFFQGQF